VFTVVCDCLWQARVVVVAGMAALWSCSDAGIFISLGFLLLPYFWLGFLKIW